MGLDLEAFLRRALDDIDAGKQRDALEQRFKNLEDRLGRVDIVGLAKALDEASDEELSALEGTVLEGLIKETVRDGENDNPPPKQDAKDVARNDDKKDPPPPKRTRPGRKSGVVYGYDVDDEGRIVPLKIAKVFTGEDEPDEVELPDEEEGGGE